MRRYDDDLPMLLAYQDAWMRETAPIALVEKSRRIGLSWGDAAERVVYAGSGAGDVYYMSYSKDMTSGYISDCAEWAVHLDQACAAVTEEHFIVDEKQLLRYRLNFDSGKSIIALTSHPRALRSKGRPGDVVVIDEAAFCDDLDELLKAAVAVTQWGGKVRIISTHNGADNPFHLLIQRVRARRPAGYALHCITLDVAIRDGLARRICSVKGDTWTPDYEVAWRAGEVGKYTSREDADEELFCVPRQGGGAYFSRALLERCMGDAPVIRYSGSDIFGALPEPERRAQIEDWLASEVAPLLEGLDPLLRHVAGYDFARSRHMSVIAPMEIGATLHRTCPFLLELTNVPHMQQLQIFEFVARGLPRFSGAAIDATGNGSFVAEGAADIFGSSVIQVMFSEAWYREWMPRYRALYEDQMITVPRHDDILEDHRSITLLRGVPRVPPQATDRRGARHGDSAIALALATQAEDERRVEYDYQPVRLSRDADEDSDDAQYGMHTRAQWRGRNRMAGRMH